MELKKLNLDDFRNYKNVEYVLGDGVTVIYGNNAKGKTNILEAIGLLAYGDSFKAKKVDEMIRFSAEFSKVSGVIADDDEEELELQMILTKGVLGETRVAKKRYLVDGAPKTKKGYLGNLLAVIFRPEDLSLISGSPDNRRTMINRIFIQIDEEYQRSLTAYEQALRRRNKLLDAIREGAATRYALTFWDGLLIRHGQVISQKRRDWVDYVNSLWSRSELFNKLKLVYDASSISEARLEQYKVEEEMVGYTLVGPHKDDFVVLDGDRNLGIYGSRGEQRMAVLALKMGEIYFIEDRSEKKPLLLLDDIFSELDKEHSMEVMKVMKNRQVVVTTANKDDLGVFKEAKIIELE